MGVSVPEGKEDGKTGGTGMVRFEAKDGVAFITLASPPLNILSMAMMDQLTASLERARADRSLLAVAISAEGRAFSAGADIGEHRPEQAPAMIAAFGRLFALLGAIELPVVIAVDGPALGAGFELALMADILLATDRSTFGQPEIRLGFFAPVGVTALPTRVGLQRAIEITCTGRTYTAAEMAEMGLVRRVVAAEQLTPTLDLVLADLRRASPLIMRMNVRVLRQSLGQRFEVACPAAERIFLDDLMATEDVREGIAAFYEKRRPAWKNR
jgi:cyclohexa-1,5-dienecarbonyl-CoA hydratase